MAHTPGPWRVEVWLQEDQPPYVVTDNVDIGRLICDMPAGENQDWDNARLIAAAPDLLAACDQTISDLQGIANIASGGCDEQEGTIIIEIVQHIADNLAVAIAKARGGQP